MTLDILVKFPVIFFNLCYILLIGRQKVTPLFSESIEIELRWVPGRRDPSQGNVDQEGN